MAIEEFWANLQTAASLLGAPRDADAVRAKRATAQWFNPQSVTGFDPREFDFLNEETLAELARHVERFRTLVQHTPRKKAPTPTQEAEARGALDEIIRLVQLRKYRDAEALRSEVLLERELRGELPRWVTGISCVTGLDLIDEPAIWIYVNVTDAATDKKLIAKHGHKIDEKVADAYRRIGGRRFPFIRFRSPDLAYRNGGTK